MTYSGREFWIELAKLALILGALAALAYLTMDGGYLFRAAHAQYTDGATSEWFKSLSSPYVRNCCDQADCALAESDYHDGDWWAKSNRTGEWVRIQPGNITEAVSVFPKAVLCEGDPYLITDDGPVHYEPHVYCFAPAPLGF